jgi:hypothetical protein
MSAFTEFVCGDRGWRATAKSPQSRRYQNQTVFGMFDLRLFHQKSFTLADVRLRGEVPADEVILFWAKAGLTVVAMRLSGLVNR